MSSLATNAITDASDGNTATINEYTEGKWDFNKAFPVFNKVTKPICGKCDGRGVIPTAERNIVACPDCKKEQLNG